MPENIYMSDRRGPGRMTNEQFQAWRNKPRALPTVKPPEVGDAALRSRFAADMLRDYGPGKAPVASKLSKFVGAGSKLASKVANLPGARVAGKTMGRLALPVAAAQGAYDLANLGYEGYLANKAANEAAREQDYSSSKYGTPERATTSRRSSKGIMSDWSEPSNYVLTKSNSNDFGW